MKSVMWAIWRIDERVDSQLSLVASQSVKEWVELLASREVWDQTDLLSIWYRIKDQVKDEVPTRNKARTH